MRVVKPVTIAAGSALLTSSTVAEPSGSDPAAWAVGTAYAVGQFAYLASTHRVYQCLVANTGNSPDVNLTGTAPLWLDWGPTNKWAMFDQGIATLSTATSPLTVVVAPGQGINALAALELSGTAASVVVKSTPGGTTVYTNSTSLDNTLIIDWYQYFFDPYVFATQWVLTDIPSYINGELTFTLTGPGSVSCGTLLVGTSYYLGEARYGASVGITDYSSKTIDTYGRTVITKRTYSRRMQVDMLIDSSTFNKIADLLSNSLRAVPSLWIGTDSVTYAPMVIYGYYKDWSMSVAYPTSMVCSLQIEGLT